MPENTMQEICLQCGLGPDEIPLVPLVYQDKKLWICPQHLPLLIHNPARLEGKLPGAESFPPASHDD
ncbi:MAG: hypothetical protein OEV06_02815 [Anaerolineae bacterium]|nr:hypothetical protein [Anaerolineae bacterium]